MVTAGFAHPAFLYRNAEDYIAGTVPFIRDGLAAGEPVAVAVPGPRLKMIAAELGYDAARTTLIDMGQAGRNPGRIIPSVLRAFSDQYPRQRTRIVGEPIWAERTDAEYPACVQHEALINLAFADRPVTILCPYDVTALSESVIADANTTHPVLVDSTGARASVDYDPAVGMAAGNVALPARPDCTELIFSGDTLQAARRYAMAQARRVGLSERRVLDVELIVSELASNSVLHGRGRGSLRVYQSDGYFVCEVRNAGAIADPLAGRRPVAPQEPRGRGLLLVNQIADLVRVHTTTDATAIRAYLFVD